MNLTFTRIVYLAHGPKNNHKQVVLSVLTLLNFINKAQDNVKILIYTDDKAFFEKHIGHTPLLEYEYLSPSLVKEGMGKYNFIHRLKIWIIKECINKYNCNILYLDGDTFFIKSPIDLIQQISKEKTIFHKFEYTVSDGGIEHEVPNWLTFRKLVKGYEYNLRGEPFKFDLNSQMWNAGVIGLSKENFNLLEDVLDLTDQIISKMDFKTAEQFAFTYVMGKNSFLIPAENYIYHYFLQKYKAIYNYHISILLKDISELPLAQKATKAVQLSQKHNQLKLPEMSLMQRLKVRIELVLKVAIYGHL